MPIIAFLQDMFRFGFLFLIFFFYLTYVNQKNADGQSMLASTLIPQPYPMNRAPLEEDVNMSFGRFVLFLMFQ